MLEYFKSLIFTIGAHKISLFSVLLFVLIVLISYILANLFAAIVKRAINKNPNLNRIIAKTATKFTRYTIIIIGFYIAFQVLGINLSAFDFLAGAIGLGIGFGMQNIIGNLVSGIIILFEKPIKNGDYIEVAGYEGIVSDIRARSTTITTKENITIIVPNSNFITSNIINWSSHKDPKIMLNIPLGIQKTVSELDSVKKILLDIVDASHDVLKDPPPSILFQEFGSQSFNLELMVWTKIPDKKHLIISDIKLAIAKKFAENGIDFNKP